MNTWKKIRDVLFGLIIILVIPQLASEAANHLAPAFEKWDTNGVYAWITIHHVAQLLLALLLMLIIARPLSKWGLNLDNKEKSLEYIKGFILYVTGFVIVGHIILYFTSPAPTFRFPLTAENIIGELGFKLLLSGTSEEILFRGLVMTLLLRSWPEKAKIFGLEISWAGIWATLFFVLAHIGFRPFPFEITFIDPMQLGQALLMGTFYAIVFDKTRSLLTPILAHNFFNFFLTGVGMLWVFLAR
jgi:membrane protease YdiL (CAAX protease family)